MNQHRTFGVEIEVIIPTGKTREQLAQWITEQANVTCISERYNHTTRRHWKIVTDASIGYDNGEVVSPILQNDAGLAELRSVADAIDGFGCTVNVSCGTHVHIGAGDLSLSQIKRLLKNYVKFEDMFDHIMPRSRRVDGRYARSVRNRIGGSYSNSAVNDAFDRIDHARTLSRVKDLIGTRFCKVNLEALSAHGTIEFRQHSGTTDAAKLSNWVQLLMAFFEGSIHGSPRKRKGEQTVSVGFARFFKMFDCKHLQPFYNERRKALNPTTTRRRRAA